MVEAGGKDGEGREGHREVVEGLIEEHHADGEVGEEAGEVVESGMARVDEGIGGISTEVVDMIGEDDFNSERGEEGREVVDGTSERALHGERGEGSRKVVDVLVELAGNREALEGAREVVNGVVEVAREGEGDEGGGEVVNGLVEVGSESDVRDVGVRVEVKGLDGEGVVIVKDNFGNVGGKGGGEGYFVEENTFGGIHFVVCPSRPVESKLGYLRTLYKRSFITGEERGK